MFETYKPSGRFGLLVIPLTLLGIGGAAGLSYLYQLGLYWLPLIYISFLLTIVFGIALGMIGSEIVTRSKTRNTWLAMGIGLLLTFAGVGGKSFLQYQHFLTECTEAAMKIPDLNPALNKSQVRNLVKEKFTFGKHIEHRVDEGWKIGQGRIPITGVFVYGIWLIELVVIGFCIIDGMRTAASEPFSEKLDEWALEKETLMRLPIGNNEMVAKIKSATTVAELLEMPIPKSIKSNQYAIYRVNSIEGQETEDAYLSVNLTTVTIEKNGSRKTETTTLVQHAILSAEQRKQLVENAELLNEAMEDYEAAMASGTDDESEEAAEDDFPDSEADPS